ncbi:MAG: hypothetical protein PVI59_04785 [Anaerolineae bacterium]|jgi:hypothetical protein
MDRGDRDERESDDDATTVVTTVILLAIAGLVKAGPDARSSQAAGASPVVSYQGQVEVNDQPYNGTGYFKFAIVDAGGTTTYWSNDGTSTGGGEPTDGTPLPVSDGLFNVLLGDTALNNMTEPLEAAAFDGAERYLRVWFSSDDVDYRQLSPDRRIAAVPYALQAQEAADADTVDGEHATDLALPAAGMVLGATEHETTLIDAGFSYTGLTVESEDWSVRTALPAGRCWGPGAAVVNGVVYVIGGFSQAGRFETANEAYISGLYVYRKE